MERADVVHVRADVRVRRVKGRLRPHRGVPLGRYPNEGDVGESRTSRQRRRPAGRQRRFSQTSTFSSFKAKLGFHTHKEFRDHSSQGILKIIFCIFQMRTNKGKSIYQGDFKFLFKATFCSLQPSLAAALHSGSSRRRHLLGSKAAFTAAS